MVAVFRLGTILTSRRILTRGAGPPRDCPIKSRIAFPSFEPSAKVGTVLPTG